MLRSSRGPTRGRTLTVNALSTAVPGIRYPSGLGPHKYHSEVWPSSEFRSIGPMLGSVEKGKVVTSTTYTRGYGQRRTASLVMCINTTDRKVKSLSQIRSAAGLIGTTTPRSSRTRWSGSNGSKRSKKLNKLFDERSKVRAWRHAAKPPWHQQKGLTKE